jgi:hypothetical protein
MQERNQQSSSSQPSAGENEMANRGHGAQGIDKAPGEETSQDNVQFSQEAFKGKKVDRVPGEESDEPADQSSL